MKIAVKVNRIHHYYHWSFPAEVRYERARLDIGFVCALIKVGMEYDDALRRVLRRAVRQHSDVFLLTKSHLHSYH
jgi:hypothetical protein